jgi:trimeric autotransporter adhesin
MIRKIIVQTTNQTNTRVSLVKSVHMFQKLMTILSLVVTISTTAFSQSVGINSTGTEPNSSSMLDVVSTTKGILIPRLALTALNSNSPVGASIATSLLVYNTATAGTAPNNVVPGFYFWNGTKWVALTGSGGMDWGITGNAGTSSASNFIGTTDAQPLVFKTNNIKAGQLEHDIFTANTAMGFRALLTNAASYNTAFGFEALKNNTYAGSNTALGSYAMESQSFANANAVWHTHNVAIGLYSLWRNQPTTATNAVQNVGVGNYSLQNNTIGHFNTAIGHEAMRYNTTGSRNTALGDRALFSQAYNNSNVHYNTDNVAVGYEALYFNQPTSPANGIGNTAVGFYALRSNYTGNYNTAIGNGADVSTYNLNYTTAIGYNAKAEVSNTMILGGTGVSAVSVGIGTSTPKHTLDVTGRMHLANGVIQRGGTSIYGTSDLGLYQRAPGNWMRFVTNGAPIRFFSDDSIGTFANFSIEANGNIGIGTTTIPAGYKVAIDGKLICEEARIQNSTAWPDYVFNEDYKLLPLEDLEKIIRQQKHLPGIPSASVVSKEGFGLGDMNVRLLEKVEELTLYMIDLKKENSKLAERIKLLESSKVNTSK